MSRHSSWGGSNAAVWSACPGSVHLSKLAPSKTVGVAAERGTAMHEAAAKALTGSDMHDACSGLSPEESALVASYVADVETLASDTTYIEAEFVHPTYLDIFGTIDLAAIKDTTCRLVDLKTGQIEVYAENNSQLMYYAWLILLRHPSHIVDFELGIWQGGMFKWWNTTAKVIAEYGEQLERQYKANYLSAGEHCIKCNAFAICGEARRSLGIVKTLPPVVNLSAQQIADRVPLTDKLRAIAKAIDETALSMALDGRLPGYKIVDGRKRPLAWKVEDIDTSKLGIRDEDVYESKLKTATQIAKLCSEEKLIELGYAERPAPHPDIAPVIKSVETISLTDW